MRRCPGAPAEAAPLAQGPGVKGPYKKLQHCEQTPVPGGHIRYDLLRATFGAHCTLHRDQKCKMDRACKKNALGHMCAWLQLAVDCPDMSCAEHQEAKMSDARLPFAARSAKRGELAVDVPALCDVEFEHSRNREEPPELTN